MDENLPQEQIDNELPQEVDTDAEVDIDQDSGENEQNDNQDDQTQEAEFEEVEVNGEKYQVPKALKGAFLMQADYTRKTQEVSEMRREIEQERQLVEARNATIDQRAQLSALDNQLKGYNGVDWTSFTRENPVEAQVAWQNYQQLKDARQNLNATITQTESELAYQQQALHQDKLRKGAEELKRDIPNWSPELGKQLAEFGVNLGFSQEEMANVYDPRLVKLLHAAMTSTKLVQGKIDSAKAKQPQTVKPVKPVSGGNANSSRDPSRMSTDEWMKNRNEQLSKKRGR